jgi:hypothetical protein
MTTTTAHRFELVVWVYPSFWMLALLSGQGEALLPQPVPGALGAG